GAGRPDPARVGRRHGGDLHRRLGAVVPGFNRGASAFDARRHQPRPAGDLAPQPAEAMTDAWTARDLVFVPLGGSGEIGMDLNLYGHAGKGLMVDCGMSFAEPGLPGVELIVPDPTFIEERRGDLLGLILTHAHEDHLGAVAWLWPRFRCPVYATAFAAAIL